MRFKIEWARFIVEKKFTVFALLYFVFDGNFKVHAPGGACIWRGDLTGFFCVTSLGGFYLEGLIHYFRNLNLLTNTVINVFILPSPFFLK